MNSLFSNGFTLNDTYIIFTSDHGEMNLEHRQYGKNSMYEPATRIPLFIIGPNVKQQIITNFTQVIDILPTLIDIANNSVSSKSDSNDLENELDLEGSSLMPFFQQ